MQITISCLWILLALQPLGVGTVRDSSAAEGPEGFSSWGGWDADFKMSDKNGLF